MTNMSLSLNGNNTVKADYFLIDSQNHRSMKNEWEEHLATLDAEDRKDPFRVIKMFCLLDFPFRMRWKYQDLFIGAMYSDHNENEEPNEKGDRMWLMYMTIHLAEAAYLINKLIEEKELTYSIKPAV